MTQMISHEIKICVICVTDTLCHISKDGSVHDLEGGKGIIYWFLLFQ